MFTARPQITRNLIAQKGKWVLCAEGDTGYQSLVDHNDNETQGG